MFLCLFCLANQVAAQMPVYRSFVDLTFRGGTPRDGMQGSLFLPLLYDDDELAFADIRGLVFDDNSQEGNWGLGYRKVLDSGWIAGFYGFYDLRSTRFNNTFQQATAGAELLNEYWGFRVNGYIPERGTKNTNSLNGAFLTGSTIFVQSGLEAAYYGIDGEVEGLLHTSGGFYDAEVWGAVGGFHFDNDNARFENISGPRARVELRLYDLPRLGIDSRVVLGGQVEYDDVRGTQGTGMFTVRIPFGRGGSRSNRLTPFERRMVNPIVRDVDVVTNTTQTGPEIAQLSDGTLLNNVTVVDANTANVAGSVAGAGANSVVVFDSSQGPINLNTQGNASVTLQPGQFAGGQFEVFGSVSGFSTTFGTRPTVSDPTNALNVFTLANNSTVTGMDIGGGMNGIFGTSVTGFTISNNNISGAKVVGLFSGSGVNLHGVNDGDIVGNTASGNEANGIDIFTFTGGSISGNTASGNQLDGFNIWVMNGGSVSGNTASGNQLEGFHIQQDFNGGSLNGNTSSSNQGTGIKIARLGGGSVSGNTASGNQVEGIRIGTLNSGTVSGNTASGNQDFGFSIGVFNNGTVSGNTATGNQSDGFAIFQLNGGSVSGNTSTGNLGDGFRILPLGFSGGSLSGNTASGNQDDGFDISFALANTATFMNNVATNNSDAGYEITNTPQTGSNNTGNGNGSINTFP